MARCVSIHALWLASQHFSSSSCPILSVAGAGSLSMGSTVNRLLALSHSSNARSIKRSRHRQTPRQLPTLGRSTSVVGHGIWRFGPIAAPVGTNDAEPAVEVALLGV